MQVGPYRVLTEIARGGMGVVYRAQGPDGRAVALKVLLHAESATARSRLAREVEALSRLRHPHVVGLLGAGEVQARPWLALELVEGQTLEARLRQGPLAIEDAVRIGRQLAGALSYVHACGVLHRDLKPDNVLLRGEDALLTDFGLVLDAQTEGSRITATGVFQGTPGYWAPEQARGDKHGLGAWTDVYGLGGVLYAALTGRAPIEASSLGEYLAFSQLKQVVAPRERRPDVPRWLNALVLGCLAQAPDQRPASADAVARALASGGATSAPARGPRLVVAAVGVVLAAGGGLAWALATPSAGPPRPSGQPAPVASAAAPGPASDPEPSEAPAPGAGEALTEQGLRALLEGRDADALALLTRAVEEDPSSATAWRERGVAHSRLGKRQEAIEDYRRALERDPEDVVAWHNQGRNLAQLRRYARAEACYDRALELSPGFVNARNDRAACRGYQRDFAGAVADYDQVLQVLQDPSAYLNRGVCRGQLDDPGGASADFDRALTLDPDYVRARLIRAEFRAKREDFAGAAEDYARAVELEPRNRGALYQLGVNSARLERYAEAVAAFDRAQAQGLRSAALFRDRAVCKGLLRDFAGSIADCSAGLELDPQDPALYMQRGRARAELDRDAAAADDFSEVLRRRPGDAYARVLRGRCLEALGRDAEALADFDRALELAPELEGAVQEHRARVEARLAGRE